MFIDLYGITFELSIPVAIAILASGLVGSRVVINLIEILPKRMEEAWRNELISYRETMDHTVEFDKYRIRALTRIIVIVFSVLLPGYIFMTNGVNSESIAYAFLFLCVIALVGINQKHQLLPDDIVIPLLWCGLLFHGWNSDPLANYVYGAAVGYLSPFTIYIIIKMFTGKETIGHGDFKTFSALGAWFGLDLFPALFLTFIGVIIAGGIILAIFRKIYGALPTGWYYAISSFIIYVFRDVLIEIT